MMTEVAEQEAGVLQEDAPQQETKSDHVDSAADERPEVAMETQPSEGLAAASQKPGSGSVVVLSNKSPAGEKLERVRKWSVSTYKCARQALAERLGRGSRTVDLDLEPRLELLKDDRQRYGHMTALAQTLANQLAQFTLTQKSLGDAFADLGMKTPALHVEFSMNAAAQNFLSKSGETLTAAINTFTGDMNTLVNRTMEDTMATVRQYEAVRVEYDAYRVDLEELNLGPRDAVTLPRLEQAQRSFQGQKERYQRSRGDLSVKVRLLQDNKVKVLHQQLWLLHGAVAAHALSCHHFLEQNARQASGGLAGVQPPSWLEES